MGITIPLLDDERFGRLAEDVRARVARHVPEWTDHNDSDPGIAFVQVFAFLGEQLLVRSDDIPERGRRLLRETAARLARIPAREDTGPFALSAGRRVRYVEGRLLTAADLRDEQQYHLGRRWLLNRALHGAGIVTGLDVHVSGEAAPPAVTVSPGFALDARGREVVVTAPQTLTIAGGSSARYVMVEYAEFETEPVPLPGADGAADTVTPTRILEGSVVRLVDTADCPDGIVVGRVVLGAAGWSVDRAFVPRRVRDVPRA
jgi:hypothetical protein